MSADARPPRVVACPTCQKSVPWVAQSRFRPFCSERCRLIDLGAWASGEYRVPDGGRLLDDPAQDSPLDP